MISFNTDIVQTLEEFFFLWELDTTDLCVVTFCNRCPHPDASTLMRINSPLKVLNFYSNARFSVVLFLFANIKSSTALEFRGVTYTEICNTGAFQPRKCFILLSPLLEVRLVQNVWCPGRGPGQQ